MNEEASDKVLEVEQKYNEVRRPIYQKRNEIIEGIADFWLTAVSKNIINFVSMCMNMFPYFSSLLVFRVFQ